MKLTDKLVEKVGADKLLHFLLTAWLVAEAKVYGELIMLLVFIVIILVGIYKEKKLDVKADYADVKWSIYGGLCSWLLYLANGSLFGF